nr:unnamed protein product [Rangifer tarandus platyrhynchus]
MRARETKRQVPEDWDISDISELLSLWQQPSPSTHKELVPPQSHHRESKWHWSPPSQVPYIPGSRGVGCPDLWQDSQHYLHKSPGTTGRAGHLLSGRQAEQRHCATQAGLTGSHAEETDDTPQSPSSLPRDYSIGRRVTLSHEEPGATTRTAAPQEAGPTEQGMWSIQRGLLGA